MQINVVYFAVRASHRYISLSNCAYKECISGRILDWIEAIAPCTLTANSFAVLTAGLTGQLIGI